MSLLEIHNLHASAAGKEILRGIKEEDAVSLIVGGYAKEVVQKLPMEFAVEAQKLLSLSIENSVG